MMLSELTYPQRLVVEMLHYSTWACEKTQNMKCSEILKALGVFFTEDQLSDAKAILEGKPIDVFNHGQMPPQRTE
jgi:hypothetical protein